MTKDMIEESVARAIEQADWQDPRVQARAAIKAHTAALSAEGYVIVPKIEPGAECAACGKPDKGCYPCMSAARPGFSPVPCQPILQPPPADTDHVRGQ